MKKLNKKGFTLAELLIVIAIIAILIAIAIPAFGSALDNARLQTDHANMRSAYAIAQVANMQGYIEVTDASGTVTKKNLAGTGAMTTTDKYYFGADGSVTSVSTNAYVTAIGPGSGSEKCKSSAFCQKTAHVKNKPIIFKMGTDGNVSATLDS